MKFRYLPFVLLAVVALVLATATLVERQLGTEAALQHVYTAPWMIALWGALVVTSAVVIMGRRLHRRPATLLLHVALVTILCGALVTHLWGTKGQLHLRTDAPQSAFLDTERHTSASLPFTLRLVGFEVHTYPGTQSPMDYVSTVEVDDEGQTAVATLRISMNHIGQYRSYRLYQSGYDDDRQGSTLLLSHDPWGIAVTYTGYALLLVSMLLLLVLPGEGFRRLLRQRTAATLLLLLVGTAAQAAPKALPKEQAEEFGQLYVHHNGRICPLQTLARDFTTKLYGKPTYQGLTAEQVLTGWMLFPTEWVDEPMIKVKGSVARLLGIEGRYASYSSFHGPTGYRLDGPLSDLRRGQLADGRRDIIEADEKMNILLMLFNGQLLKLYPCRDSEGHVGWYSQADRLPEGVSEEQSVFVRKSMDYVGELVWMKQYDQLSQLLGKMRTYQQREAADVLPTPRQFRAELLYNQADHTRPLAMLLVVAGLLAFVAALVRMAKGATEGFAPFLRRLLALLLVASSLYLLLLVALRGYVGGHLPLASGFETMQLMALLALVLALPLRRFTLAAPFALLIGGLALLVATMGQATPQLTPLMPVLASPLLSIHVCTVMLAYALLAYVALCGLAALVLAVLSGEGRPAAIATLTRMSRLLLFPAVCCLAAGIFIGAVWANVSWGAYWSWDPKETWALITLLVYAIALHHESLPLLRRPVAYHLYVALAFLTILMTYFGVNFILGGMHSYA